MIVYYLGKILGRRYRVWWHIKNDGRWCWGIIQYLIDSRNDKKLRDYSMGTYT